MFDHSSKPGYPGRDSMRDRAEAMFRSEGRTNMRSTPNLSARDRIPARTFSKGGYADGGQALRKGGKAIHRLTKEQSDMHLPRRISSSKYAEGGETLSASKSRDENTQRLQLGGMAHGGRTLRLGGMADGGKMLKRGGKPIRRAEGGIADMAPAASINPDDVLAARLGGMASGGKALRHGGRAHSSSRHRASGGELRRAQGGSIYEREMIGESPSRRAPNINYESNMRGERGVQRRFSEGGETAKKCGGAMRADGGSLRKGGRPGHRHSAEGGSYAAGGVGKMRLGQATSRGLPINRRGRGH